VTLIIPIAKRETVGSGDRLFSFHSHLVWSRSIYPSSLVDTISRCADSSKPIAQ
jgi:hypothetical protein